MIYLGNSPVGVGVRECGQFKRCAVATATPTTNGREMTFSNPLGEIPKLVIIECATETTSRISKLVLIPETGMAVLVGVTASQYQYYPDTGGNAATFTLSASSIYVTRQTAAYLLDANETYTAYIYA